MAATLHDPTVRDSLRQRVQSLDPNAQHKWGKMSADQMMWHVSEALSQALGEKPAPREAKPAPLPLPVLKFMVLNMPWPKGAPTASGLNAGEQRFDFAVQRTRCLRLIDQFGAKNAGDVWAESPILGKMTGAQWGRLHAKHLDHHLRQFGG